MSQWFVYNIAFYVTLEDNNHYVTYNNTFRPALNDPR
jgi:hypothetical protein